MFDIESAIRKWRTELQKQRVGGPEILDELESHLREEYAKLRECCVIEAECFRLAVDKMGSAKGIKREFTKLRLEHLNSLSLKILGFWFVLMGLRSLSLLPIFSVDGISGNSGRVVLCLVLCAWHVLVGIGLLKQSNFWRWCAMVWGALFLVACVLGLHPWQGSLADLPSWGFIPGEDFANRLSGLSRWRTTFLGTRLADFRHVIDFITPAAMVSALYFLCRPKMKTSHGRFDLA